MVAEGGSIFKTSDGGNFWISQISGTTSGLFSVACPNLNYGTVVGTIGKILNTTDGGLNWIPQISNTTKPLYSVSFSDSLNGIAVGEEGIILRTINGGVTSNENAKNNFVVKEFNLEQNYPNPFNPSTKIRYSIPEYSFVTLKVFNLLGEEIETLVNAEQSVGIYEATFDASNLSSGIYFYTLKTDNASFTKKMILVR